MEANYYLKEEAEEFKDDCDMQIDEIREEIKPLASKSEVSKLKDELKARIANNLEKTALIKTCEKDKAEL